MEHARGGGFCNLHGAAARLCMRMRARVNCQLLRGSEKMIRARICKYTAILVLALIFISIVEEFRSLFETANSPR